MFLQIAQESWFFSGMVRVNTFTTATMVDSSSLLEVCNKFAEWNDSLVVQREVCVERGSEVLIRAFSHLLL